MEFSAVSMNTWLYPDSAIDSAKHEIKLSAVRGGSCPQHWRVQIALWKRTGNCLCALN